ncbi:hypothetical protein RJ46_06080 [Vibrio sinaloensis]|nr:hypothetical protein RJ46_06080 [Vibrio sinaloensis]
MQQIFRNDDQGTHHDHAYGEIRHLRNNDQGEMVRVSDSSVSDLIDKKIGTMIKYDIFPEA